MRVAKHHSIRLFGCASVVALGSAILAVAPAHAQAAQAEESPAEEAGLGESGDENEIVVTGSRIERAGFQQPTPTTVVGATEIRQAGRENLQQVINELPQARNSVSAESATASTGSGTAPVNLRGLGVDRTLTLINGRRFIGNNNLNFVPTNLVQRLEIVTGGASAAWGSDAVAGVVNIILNDDLKGISLGAVSGISSRGDAFRYGFDGSFGTDFAGGRGHFMVGAEYVREKVIGPEGFADRPWFGADFVNVPGGREVRPNQNTNLIVAGQPLTFGGTILTGALAGQVFNPDSTIRAQREGDALNINTTLNVRSPLERISSYARMSYDVGAGATVWADLSYGRTHADQAFFPDPAGAVLLTPISATNPFLSPQIRQQLADAGETSFFLGRFSRDTFLLQFDAARDSYEGAIGIDGTLGGEWKYSAHYSHGEVDQRLRLSNSSIPSRYLRAINAVQTPGGIVCGVNADANPANDDPACVAFNPFGENAASDAARDYVRGTQSMDIKNKLDSAAVELQGDPFSLWAGPVTIAVGAEARWEQQTMMNGEADREGPSSIFGTALFRNPINGSFNVKEAFSEALVPLFDTEGFKIDFNGAARYSDYSRSGGIWSWKLGGTARLFDSVLLRTTRSRDIRAPNIAELFSVSRLNINQVTDNNPPPGAVEGVNGYTRTPIARILTGGNPDLVPEIGKTWTIGGSFSPSFFQGFNLSIDYYDIRLSGAIAALNAAALTENCAAGDAAACGQIARDPASGTIVEVRANNANISSLKTSGVDFEASYLLPMSRISSLPGTLRFRGLATYVHELNLGGRDSVGGIDSPHWRGLFSTTYQTDDLGLDLRIRYLGGGKYDVFATDILNNDVGARTYVDVGAQFKVADTFTFFGNVRNVFDKNPPLTFGNEAVYDTLGRYFTAGVRLNF